MVVKCDIWQGVQTIIVATVMATSNTTGKTMCNITIQVTLQARSNDQTYQTTGAMQTAD